MDKEHFTIQRGELYAKSGTLLKVLKVLGTVLLQGRPFPSVVEYADQLKKIPGPLLTMDSIVINSAIDPGRFSLRLLRDEANNSLRSRSLISRIADGSICPGEFKPFSSNQNQGHPVF